MAVTANEIINFWFDEEVKERWFNSNDAFDDRLRTLFEITYQSGVTGELDAWQETPEGALALVILFDQFPLNMYRGDIKSFETEALSREIASRAIGKEFDAEMSPMQKAFLYLPFMHSENIEDQQTGVNLFKAAGLSDNLRFAKHHQNIIKQFGRFPHRNKILGRENTADEERYLKSDEAFLG